MTATLPRSGRTTIRLGPASWRVHRRSVLIAAVLALTCLLLFVYSLGLDYTSPLRTWQILLGGGTRIENIVLFDDRLPRSAIALLAGAAFGLSGALTQTVARNPLATPEILGITAGASAAITAAVTLGGPVSAALTVFGMSGAAVIGGLLAGAAMYGLSWTRHGELGMNTLRLVLVGVGMTWTLTSLTGFLLARAEVTHAIGVQRWLIGSLADTSAAYLRPALLAVVIGLAWALLASRQLGALGLGADTARGLGVRVGAATCGTLAVAIVVASLAVAVTGPIGFVGLLAPQIALRLSGSAYPTPGLSALTGAALVSAADLATRTVLPPGLPVGLVTAAVGGPFLIYLMIATARKASA